MPHYPRQKIRRDDSGTRPGQPGQAGELNSGCGGGQRVVGRNCASDVLMVGSACKPTKMLKKKRAKKLALLDMSWKSCFKCEKNRERTFKYA